MKIKRILKYVMMKYGSVTSKQTKTTKVSNVLIRPFDVVSFNYNTGSTTQSISYDNTVDFKVNLNSVTSSNATINLQGPRRHSVKTNLKGELHIHFPDGLYTYSAIDLSGNTASGTFSVPTTLTGTVSIPSATIPTSLNATVQSWLNKIGSDGYAYPTQAKVDVYTAAFNYADAQGLTSKLDLFGFYATSNLDLTKIPFIHSGGSSLRFTLVGTVGFDQNQGIKGPNGYLKTNWKELSNGVNFLLNSGSYGIYIYTSISNQAPIAGIADTVNSSGESLIGYIGSLNIEIQFNLFGSDPAYFYNVPISLNGLHAISLNNGTARYYKNGSLIDTKLGIDPSDILLSDFDDYVLTNNVNDQAGYPPPLANPNTISVYYKGAGDIDQVKMNTFINMLLL